MKKKLSFENADGLKLSAILSNPTENKEKPIVILCHGFASSKDSKTYTTLEEKLNKKDLSTFRFDFFGHGASEGKFEDITITEAANDVLNAIIFLREKGYKKIGLVGSSFGGLACFLAASQKDDILFMALKSPVSDYLEKLVADKDNQKIERWKENGFMEYKTFDNQKLRLNFSFYEDASNIDFYDYIRKIKTPTLIIHGDQDETVPLKQSIKTAMLMDNCELEIMNGTDHIYSKKEDFKEMVEKIVNFISQHI